MDDLGVLVDVAEARTAAVCVRGELARLVIAARGWVLVVDPLTGTCDQLHFEDDDYPYTCMATRSGMFWTGAGDQLIRVDPFTATLTTLRPLPEEDIVGFGLAEGPDGRIWATTHPHCRLIMVDPDTLATEEGPRLSDTESYVAHLAVDDDGWLWAGVGTEHRDLVMVSPQGELTSLVPAQDRAVGTGWVHRGIDGEIYAHAEATELHPQVSNNLVTASSWQRCRAGQRTPVPASEVAPSVTAGRGFGRIHTPVPAPWQVERLALPDHELVVSGPFGERVVRLDYRSAGASLSPFVRVGETDLVGTSNHPLRFHRYDTTAEQGTVHPSGHFSEAGGNVAAWAEQCGQWYGAAYLGGHLYRWDPHAPVELGSNPSHLSVVPEAARPRCAVGHPDGSHVIWGGYGDYGQAGGALVVHRVSDDQSSVLSHQAFAPAQSPIALAVDGDGDLWVGTCVETPGGAQSVATSGAVVHLAWPELTVRNTWTPLPQVRSWAAVCPAADGTVHLVSRDGWHVHLDPATGENLRVDDWTGDGTVPYGGVITTGHWVEIVQATAINRIGLGDHSIVRTPVTDGPITVGGARIGADLYVGCGSHLARMTTGPLEEESP